MFCGKCGLKITEGDKLCPRCGKLNPGYAANRQDSQKTVYADQPPTPPEQRAPQNDNPLRREQDGGRSVHRPTDYQVPNYYNPPQELYRDDELIPEAYRYPAAEKQKNNGGKALIITVAIVVAVALGVGGFLLFTHLYHNSDEYKIQKAAELIAEEKLDEGLSYITEVQSAQADAVRAYADILRVKQQFADAYNSAVLQNASDPPSLYYNTLCDKFTGFTGAASLPKQLKEQYDVYRERFDAMNGVLAYHEFDYASAQRSILGYRNRKTGNKFTLDDIQNAINISEPAVNNFQDNMVNTEAYKDFTANSKALAAKTIQEFHYYTKKQVDQDKYDLDTYKRTEDNQAKFTIKNTDANYAAVVGTGLRNLTDESDIADNASTLRAALSYAWLAYCFDIE